jgi:hypothetical protein
VKLFVFGEVHVDGRVCFYCTEADGLLRALGKGDCLLCMCFARVEP